MKWVGKIHGSCVEQQRANRLAAWFAEHIPTGSSVLDVGCGDGQLAANIGKIRPDITLRGIDVLVRENTAVPVDHFDGVTIPSAKASFDYILFVDVLHHTTDPMILLREACRVARRGILLKDHTADSSSARFRLRFMDWVGNARYGVALPYNYWPSRRWQNAFAELGLQPAIWQTKLDLYPPFANWIFGAKLHFAARLEVVRNVGAAQAKPEHTLTPA